MPTLIEFFLSKYIFVLLIWMYLASAVIIAVGFKVFKIKHRLDVIVRGVVMQGTYIFLCHAIGIMFMIIMYIFLKINSVEIFTVWNLFVTLISGIICNLMYIVTSNYLWERLAIDKKQRQNLIIFGLLFATPWYYFLNLL